MLSAKEHLLLLMKGVYSHILILCVCGGGGLGVIDITSSYQSYFTVSIDLFYFYSPIFQEHETVVLYCVSVLASVKLLLYGWY